MTCPQRSTFPKAFGDFHHIPPNAKVFVPPSIERGVWEYFSVKAERKGVEPSDF